MEEYNLIKHRHRFAAWCGATASSASSKCRFSVRRGVELLEEAKLNAWLEHLPPPETFDDEHRAMREQLVKFAERSELVGFSHGVAAKMINCYLKAAYIGSSEKLAYIHPPIDRLLINKLIRVDSQDEDSIIWREINRTGGWWSAP